MSTVRDSGETRGCDQQKSKGASPLPEFRICLMIFLSSEHTAIATRSEAESFQPRSAQWLHPSRMPQQETCGCSSICIVTTTRAITSTTICSCNRLCLRLLLQIDALPSHALLQFVQISPSRKAVVSRGQVKSLLSGFLKSTYPNLFP